MASLPVRTQTRKVSFLSHTYKTTPSVSCHGKVLLPIPPHSFQGPHIPVAMFIKSSRSADY